MNAKGKCKGHAVGPCQFGKDPGVGIVQEGSETYCIYHAPSFRTSGTTASIKYAIDHYRDLHGIYFVKGRHSFVSAGKQTYNLRGCTFAPDTALHLAQATYDFTGAATEGDLSILQVEDITTAVLDTVSFAGRLKVRIKADGQNIGRSAYGWSIRNSRFAGEVDLQGVCFKGSLRLDGSRFISAVRLDEVQFPQLTTIHRTSFGPQATAADAEGGYRHARQQFRQNGNRDLEGAFYALEKRSQCKGFEWWRITRWMNKAYDEVAEYGQNYVRVLGVFLAVQLIAYEAYAGLAFSRWTSGPTFDDAVAAFTLAQIVKPFELLAARQPEAWFYKELLPAGAASLPVAVGAILHSIASLVLVALFILALRWRFRRE